MNTPKGGFNFFAGSDWEGAHMVYVPYCSSDAHMGDSEHEVIGLNVFAFLISINVKMKIQNILQGNLRGNVKHSRWKSIMSGLSDPRTWLTAIQGSKACQVDI